MIFHLKVQDLQITSYYSSTLSRDDLRRSFSKLECLLAGRCVLPFDETAQLLKSMKKVIISKDNWRKSVCTCAQFQKMYVCKHVICLILRHKLEDAPLEAKKVPLGEKRKRGRPEHAKKALLRN